jgi:tRNA modification GTPase
MSNYNEDTIAAVATAVGDGAISIVRVSGKRSIELIDKVFSGKQKLIQAHSHTIHYGKISDPKGQIIDEVLAAVFKSPNSYTSEDMVEINCHGGWFVTNRMLQTILDSGARMAEPGEFTKRAFVNGRIDLVQAEAVADLIKARSDLAHKASISQLEGKLSNKLINLNSQLINLIGLIELELDFVEEQISLIDSRSAAETLSNIIQELKKLSDSFKLGKLYREGIKVVIAGKPNSGKSSLLNLLLKENRAIVTPIPGTTRDVIEENFIIDGALFVLTDTAGIRTTSDYIEIEGVKRSHDKIREADIVLFVIDIGTKSLEDEIKLIKQISFDNKHILIVLNKIDLVNLVDIRQNKINTIFPNIPNVLFSALNRIGLQELELALFNAVFSDRPPVSDSSIYIVNERHKQAILAAIDSLNLARKSEEQKLSGEFAAVDLRAAIDSLGSIIGKVTTEDILNDIFSNFCIGK